MRVFILIFAFFLAACIQEKPSDEAHLQFNGLEINQMESSCFEGSHQLEKNKFKCSDIFPNYLWTGEDLIIGEGKHKISSIESTETNNHIWDCHVFIQSSKEKKIYKSYIIQNCNPYTCQNPQVIKIPEIALLRNCLSLKHDVSRIDVISEKGSLRLF